MTCDISASFHAGIKQNIFSWLFLNFSTNLIKLLHFFLTSSFVKRNFWICFLFNHVLFWCWSEKKRNFYIFMILNFKYFLLIVKMISSCIRKKSSFFLTNRVQQSWPCSRFSTILRLFSSSFTNFEWPCLGL